MLDNECRLLVAVLATSGVPRDRSGVSGPSQSADAGQVERAGCVPWDRRWSECGNQVRTGGGLSLSGREPGMSGVAQF